MNITYNNVTLYYSIKTMFFKLKKNTPNSQNASKLTTPPIQSPIQPPIQRPRVDGGPGSSRDGNTGLDFTDVVGVAPYVDPSSGDLSVGVFVGPFEVHRIADMGNPAEIAAGSVDGAASAFGFLAGVVGGDDN